MATKIIQQERINEITELLIEGRTRIEILNHLKNKYGVSRRTYQYELEEAFNQIREQYEKDNGHTISKHFAVYDKIITKSIEDKMYDVALKAMVQKEKLLKLHLPDTQINIQQNTMNLDNKTVEELKELLKFEETKI